MDNKQHWDKVYGHKAPNAVSWYAPHLETSLNLIHQASTDKSAAIIDIGGGESTLVDDLLAEAYQDISVLDISQKAIDVAKDRIGKSADMVNWYCADITQATLSQGYFDVWHDRASFHFLTLPEDISTYSDIVIHSLNNKGYLFLGTFSENGPLKCSGLEVSQYSEAKFEKLFANDFDLQQSFNQDHETPFNTVQNFIFCHYIKK